MSESALSAKIQRLEAANKRLREGWDAESLKVLACGREQQRLMLENERLRAQVSRLRKAVNWLRGSLHGQVHPEHVLLDACDKWDCQRARAILEDTREDV
jgi:hypothetical protein